MFGLSLCIQGTYDRAINFAERGRFIPVHTGNIFFPLTKSSLKSVYPCAYREHSIGDIRKLIDDGLSLCIQGTLIRSAGFGINSRFIPVHTGNIPIITYCFIIKILTTKFLPIFLAIFFQNSYL